MANPQKEDGYTAIANEIIEALAGIRISGEEWQCLCCILRKTYGWNKIKDAISLSQFEDITGINKQNICRALNRLLSKKIITIIKKDNGITEYALQKDFDLWEPLSKKITLSKKIKGIIKKDKKTDKIVIKKDKYKNNIKTTITKDTSMNKSKNKVKSKKEWSPEIKFLVAEYFKTLTEKQQIRFENKRYEFHDCCDKLIRIDKFSEEEIRKAIKFSRNDNFWSQNFLSFSKLRKTDKDGVKYIEVFLNRLEKQESKQSQRYPTYQVDKQKYVPLKERRENWLKMIDKNLGEKLSVFQKKDLEKIKKKLDTNTYERVMSILKERGKE